MPVSYKLDPEARFIQTRCTGEVTLDEVMGHFLELEANPDLPDRLDVYLDLDGMTSLPESGQLRTAAHGMDRMKSKVEWGSCAILASSDGIFGISRMFEVFADGVFERTRVFRTREEAVVWLTRAPSPSTQGSSG